MTAASEQLLEPRTADVKREERRAAGVACGAHALHDGYTDLIYVMLPIWQQEFGLGYGELGLLQRAACHLLGSIRGPAEHSSAVPRCHRVEARGGQRGSRIEDRE
jgi:hypothetical protein